MKYFVTSKISDNMRKTPEGFLVCIGVPIARTGQQEYADGETPVEVADGGTAMIQRDATEVFRPETIASFEGKPFTIGHPDEMVNPDNWSTLAHGTIQNVRRGEGEYANSLIADILVTSADAISEIENGVREVSCGYDAEYIQTGIGKGKQTNIIGNHLALVEEGRAGSDYAIKDHKGVKTMSVKDKIKKIFQKAQDEALKAATADEGMEVLSGDEAPPWADALTKAVSDLNASVSSMGNPTTSKDAEEKEAKAKDAEGEKKEEKPVSDADAMDARLSKIEDAIAALQGKSSDEDVDDEDKEDYDGDEDSDDADEEGEESKMVGDEKSKIEILAPGFKGSGKDLKAQALKACYKTKDGKAAIDALTAGKGVDFKQPLMVKMVFDAASELLKEKRSKALSKTRAGATKDGHSDNDGAPMTADKINEINKKHYEQRSH